MSNVLMVCYLSMIAALALLPSCADECDCIGTTSPVEFYVMNEEGVPLSEFEITVKTQSEYQSDLVFTCPGSAVTGTYAGREVDMLAKCWEDGVSLLPLFAGDSLGAWQVYSATGPTSRHIEVSAQSFEGGVERTFEGYLEIGSFVGEYRVRGRPKRGCCRGPCSETFRGEEVAIMLDREVDS